MTRPGSPDTIQEGETIVIPLRPPSWRLILLGVVAIIFGIVIATQVIGVLYAMVFPPAPPLPADAALVNHTGIDYGVDEWVYTSPSHPCDILAFYQEQGGECRVAPYQCSADTIESGAFTGSQHIARCTGQSSVSIFAVRWEAIIAVEERLSAPATHFRLTREVFWTGAVPPSTQP